jgi:hypothetical protein
MLRLMLMRRVIVGLAAVLILTTACTSDSGGADAPLRAEAASETLQQDLVVPENGTAPQAFIDRERLPSCGSYAWTLNDEAPADRWRCLAKSRDQGEPAEVIVQAPGIDSAGAVGYYRVTNQGDVEVWWHNLEDDEWARGACGALDATDGPADCEADEVFEPAEG